MPISRILSHYRVLDHEFVYNVLFLILNLRKYDIRWTIYIVDNILMKNDETISISLTLLKIPYFFQGGVCKKAVRIYFS